MPRYPNCKCCGCLKDCAACSCPGSPYLIDIEINELPSESCFSGLIGISGSVAVKPCIPTTGKVDPGAYVPFRFKNNTSKCVRIQLLADFTVDGSCRINGSFNCGAAFTYGTTAGQSPWFYVCLGPGVEFTGCMAHFLSGPKTPCCDREGTLDNFQYFYGCVDAFGCVDSFLCGEEFQTSCPECFPGSGGGNPGCPETDQFNSLQPCEDPSVCTDWQVGDPITIGCAECPSTFARYTVASVECVEGNCVYYLVFLECVTEV